MIELNWREVDSINPISARIELPLNPKSEYAFHCKPGRGVSPLDVLHPLAFFVKTTPVQFFPKIVDLTNQKLRSQGFRLTDINELMAVFAVRFFACFHNHVPVSF